MKIRMFKNVGEFVLPIKYNEASYNLRILTHKKTQDDLFDYTALKLMFVGKDDTGYMEDFIEFNKNNIARTENVLGFTLNQLRDTFSTIKKEVIINEGKEEDLILIETENKAIADILIMKALVFEVNPGKGSYYLLSKLFSAYINEKKKELVNNIDDIQGLDKRQKTILKENFSSVKDILEAEESEVLAIKGIGPTTLETIKQNSYV